MGVVENIWEVGEAKDLGEVRKVRKLLRWEMLQG